MKKIAIEEHFLTEKYTAYFHSRQYFPTQEIVEKAGKKAKPEWGAPYDLGVAGAEHLNRLANLGAGRLKEMDKAGIDMQVLSLSFPGVEAIDASDATSLVKAINDEISEVVKRYPERLAGFAAIAPQAPEAAADELERAVKKLGLKGAIINGHIRGEYLDNQKYQVILERAEKLGVPIYIHPRMPSPDMLKPYLAYPGLAQAILGFAADTSLHAVRLILSGVFEKYPGLKIILGHLGESIPLWLWRIDSRWLDDKRINPASAKLYEHLHKTPSQYFKDNFYVTTSGMFWHPALQFVCSVLGADRVLFATDYPYESAEEAVRVIESMPVSDSDKEKICHLNAERLLGL
jgi:2,3-dihydroxybenzoate decarboxylase